MTSEFWQQVKAEADARAEREGISQARKYEEWISAKLSSGDSWNKCAEWTTEMQSAFPELQRVRGTVLLRNGWYRDHWWLVAPDGSVVDPTVEQFKGEYFGGSTVLQYEPRDESEPEPTGMCPNCGEYCYEGRDLCSERCERQYHAYIMSSAW